MLTTRVTKILRSQALLWAVGITLITGGVALGQVRKVELSGGMDANPQVGSGGTNRPVQGYVPINGNDIMTGNVAGLKYFHGQVGRPGGGNGVGTFSPYEFSGRLGSASLFDFARTTAGATPGTPNYNGAVSQSFYLPSSTVSTSSGNIYSAPYGGGFDSALVPSTVISPILSGAMLSTNSAYSLSQAAQAAQQGSINRALPPAPRGIGEPGALLDSTLFAPRAADQAGQMPDQLQMVNPQSQGRQNTPRMGENGPATQPGNGIQTAVNTAVGGTGDQQTSRVDNQLQGTLVDARVSTAFKNLQDQLKQMQGTEDKSKSEPQGKNAGGIAGMEFDPLTGLLRQSGPTTKPGGGGAGGRSNVRTTPAVPEPRKLENLSDNQLRVGGNIKPMRLGGETNGGAGTTTFDVMMARGEASLKAGKYLDAATAYQAALAEKPQDPLALVGRAHGELGAGMYASAAYDLKFVFTRNPELISLKYDVGSFIPAARQQFLLDDLKKMSEKADSADLGSFLYAYLCYQAGRSVEMQIGLQQWGERQGHDMWQGVLSRAWKPSEIKKDTK